MTLTLPLGTPRGGPRLPTTPERGVLPLGGGDGVEKLSRRFANITPSPVGLRCLSKFCEPLLPLPLPDVLSTHAAFRGSPISDLVSTKLSVFDASSNDTGIVVLVLDPLIVLSLPCSSVF